MLLLRKVKEAHLEREHYLNSQAISVVAFYYTENIPMFQTRSLGLSAVIQLSWDRIKVVGPYYESYGCHLDQGYPSEDPFLNPAFIQETQLSRAGTSHLAKLLPGFNTHPLSSFPYLLFSSLTFSPSLPFFGLKRTLNDSRFGSSEHSYIQNLR